MTKTTFSNRQTLIAGLGASLLGSSLSIVIGLYVMHDIGVRCQQLESQYLERKRLAMNAAEALVRANTQWVRGELNSESRPFENRNDALSDIAFLIARYEGRGNLRADELTQMRIVKRDLNAYRAAVLRSDTIASSASASEFAQRVVAASDSPKRAFDTLAAIAGDRANAYGEVLSASAANISKLFLLIAAVAILAGIPPALWIMHVFQAGASSASREFHPEAAAVIGY